MSKKTNPKILYKIIIEVHEDGIKTDTEFHAMKKIPTLSYIGALEMAKHNAILEKKIKNKNGKQ